MGGCGRPFCLASRAGRGFAALFSTTLVIPGEPGEAVGERAREGDPSKARPRRKRILLPEFTGKWARLFFARQTPRGWVPFPRIAARSSPGMTIWLRIAARSSPGMTAFFRSSFFGVKDVGIDAAGARRGRSRIRRERIADQAGSAEGARGRGAGSAAAVCDQSGHGGDGARGCLARISRTGPGQAGSSARRRRGAGRRACRVCGL